MAPENEHLSESPVYLILDQLKSLSAHNRSVPYSDDEINSLFDQVESYELWQPLIQKSESAGDDWRCHPLVMKRIVRIYMMFLNTPFRAGEYAVLALKRHQLTWAEFLTKWMPIISERNQYEDQTVLLEIIWDGFPDKTDQEQCLEYLSYLYERKVYDDLKTLQTYDRLLQHNPQNLRSLRYYRTRLFKERKWDPLCDVMKSFVDASHGKPKQKMRYVLDLVNVYLYYRNDPSRALELLNQYSSEPNYEIHRARAKALFQLGQAQESIEALQQALSMAESLDQNKDILKLMIEVFQHERRTIDEQVAWRRLWDLDSTDLGVLCSLISVDVECNDWNHVGSFLFSLEKFCPSTELLQRVRALSSRIQGMIRMSNPVKK